MRSALILCLSLVLSTPVFAIEMPLKAYLQAVKGSVQKSEVTTQDSNPLLSELQLRATMKGDQLDEVKFNLTPFAWGEREKQKNLSTLERSLLELSLKSKSNESYFEIWKAILDLRKAHREKLVLIEAVASSDRLIEGMSQNSEELAAHPDSYISALSGKQELDHKLRESKAEIESLEAALGDVIGENKLSLNFEGFVSTEEIESDLLASFLTVGQTEDQLKSILAERANAEVELETIKSHRVLSFFSVGTSFKPDGTGRAIEVGAGIDLPVGTFPSKMLELQRKKAVTSLDAESAKVDRQREMKRLSTKIMNRLASLKSDEVTVAEKKMEAIHDAIVKTYGKRSLVALKSEFAIKKYRLEKVDSDASLYEDYLSLSFLRGRLDDQGRPLVRN